MSREQNRRDRARPNKRDPLRATCPSCGRSFLMDETPTPPFCCERCQMVDLGRWLDEDIGLPHEGDPKDSPVEYRDD